MKILKNMKKLKLISLSLMILVCGKSISQTVTPKKIYPLQKQENKVEIDTIVARLIANDLVSGDVCKEEINLVRGNLDLTKKEVILKDSIINTLNKQKEKLNLIIFKKDEMFSKQEEMFIKQEEISKTYKKALSKQKTTTFLYKILALLGVVSTTLLIIK